LYTRKVWTVYKKSTNCIQKRTEWIQEKYKLYTRKVNRIQEKKKSKEWIQEKCRMCTRKGDWKQETLTVNTRTVKSEYKESTDWIQEKYRLNTKRYRVDSRKVQSEY
jgi:hypothetical protein